jgi:hypothetical protein
LSFFDFSSSFFSNTSKALSWRRRSSSTSAVSAFVDDTAFSAFFDDVAFLVWSLGDTLAALLGCIVVRRSMSRNVTGDCGNHTLPDVWSHRMNFALHAVMELNFQAKSGKPSGTSSGRRCVILDSNISVRLYQRDSVAYLLSTII